MHSLLEGLMNNSIAVASVTFASVYLIAGYAYAHASLLALESDTLNCAETIPFDDLHVRIESESGSIGHGHASVARTNRVVIRAGLEVSKEQFEWPGARKSSR